MESNKPIAAPQSSLGNLLKGGVPAVRGVIAAAAGVHGKYMNVRQEEDVPLLEQAQKFDIRHGAIDELTVGDVVRDRLEKRSGTIVRELKASKETGERRFEIVDRNGDSWKQRESRLKQKY